ncbi:MAG: hypothetical protein SVY10_06945 [Thermodesulfobacteriota bacterium]|nr:hypothetical protein [Thermodesulfobacteriota bacterium]
MRSLLIEHNCPQCAGPVTLEETDRLLVCDFCRARLYFTYGDYFRYYLSPSSQPLEETVFVPYWRFKGMFFSLEPYQVKKKFLDTSLLASKNNFMPDTLGLRIQTQKLKFAVRGMKGSFLSPQILMSEVVSQVEQTCNSREALGRLANTGLPVSKIERISHSRDSKKSSKSTFHRAFIGDVTSMIYAPVYMKGSEIYDAILDRPITKSTDMIVEGLQSTDNCQNWKINFISAMCPHCGWDLEGERDSVILFCKHCDSSWQVTEQGFKRLPFSIVPSKEKNVVYIPFWRMDVMVNGLDACSYADLIRLANLPKAIQKEWEEEKLYFWSPAFTTNPKLFLRLTKQMTLFQPSEETRGTLDGSTLCPVTIPLSEALESVKIILANISIPKKKIFPLLPEMDIKSKSSLLVYFPFVIRGNEFIQNQMKFSIQRNAVRQGIPFAVS